MAIEKVPITVTTIQNLLSTGYTWLKKDDLGFGSIQDKFGATEVQIATIRKHPLLKDLETTARVFVIIDDTKDAAKNITPVSATGRVPEVNLVSVPESQRERTQHGTELLGNDIQHDERVLGGTAEEDAFSAFANL